MEYLEAERKRLARKLAICEEQRDLANRQLAAANTEIGNAFREYC